MRKSKSLPPSANATDAISTVGLLIEKVRTLVRSARAAAAVSVNSLQVLTNLEIGRLILEHEQHGQQRAEYGMQTLKHLAANLTAEFGRGYSLTNLKLMRQFYLARQGQIGQTLSDLLHPPSKGQTPSDQFSESLAGRNLQGPASSVPLSWSHYVFLLSIDDPQEPSFYEIEAAGQGWALRELKRQLNSGLYERLALSRDKARIRKLAKEGKNLNETAEDAE